MNPVIVPILSLVIILNFIIGIEDISSVVSDTEVLASTKLWLVPLDALLFIGLIGFTIYTIFSLIKLRPNAVSLAKMYLILTFLTNLMGMIFSGVTGELQLLDVMAMFELLAELLAMVIAGVIWFLYLTYSKRVNNTYPKEKRESYAIDKVFFFSILASGKQGKAKSPISCCGGISIELSISSFDNFPFNSFSKSLITTSFMRNLREGDF